MKRAVIYLWVLGMASLGTGWSNAADLESPALSAAQLRAAAESTCAAHRKAPKTGLEKPGAEIPAAYWTDGIQQLKPLKVYIHRVNLVVVQHVTEGTEEGKYIYLPLSSYLPRSGDDGFVFSPNPTSGNTYSLGTGVFDFKRARGQSGIDQP